MKVLGLLAFATVFLLSSAYADHRGRGRHSGLMEAEDRRHAETLQRRKPPGKIPGPALMADDQYQEEPNLRQLSEDEESNAYLNRNRKHSHLNSNNHMSKDKHKHLVNGEYNADNAEESQQERIESLRSEGNSP